MTKYTITLTEAQDALYTYWVMEAICTTATEDIGEVKQQMLAEIMTYTDEQAIAELEEELR